MKPRRSTPVERAYEKGHKDGEAWTWRCAFETLCRTISADFRLGGRRE